MVCEAGSLRTDGGLRSGSDIVTAAILGAEEVNFGTIAMIAMGCVYVRQCHLNNCPVGIATQDPKYRAKFKGEVEHVVNFFNAVAYDVRKHLASIGVRTLQEIIGRARVSPSARGSRSCQGEHRQSCASSWTSRVRLDVIWTGPKQRRNDGIKDAPLDDRIIADVAATIEDGRTPVTVSYDVVNTNRNIGTKLSGRIAKRHNGNHVIPDGTIQYSNCAAALAEAWGRSCAGASA